MTPGGSISSAMSVGYQVFMQHDESETNDEEDVRHLFLLLFVYLHFEKKNYIINLQAVEAMSEWQILKLNAPEWIYTTIGALAAIGQGACFPVFAMILGFFTAVR